MNRLARFGPRLALFNALFACWAVCAIPAQAQIYEQRGTILYEKIPYQKQYYYYSYGRPYYYYVTEYTYKEVLNYQKPDWRQQALTLIDRQKERESYESVLNTLGVQGLFAPKQSYVQQQSPVLYPSATGNTLGAFTTYESARYGDVSAYDANKADERVSASADTVVRMTAEMNATATGAVQQAIGLQKLNSERVGAIAEWQEMRAMMKERAIADKERALAERDKLLAEAELMKAMKPPASASVSYTTRSSASVGVGTGGGPGPGAPPPSPDSVPPPPVPPGQSHPGAALAVKFCAACHGKEKTNPAKGFYFDESVPLSQEGFGAVALRMDPQAPEFRLDANGQVLKDSDGHSIPFRMPPAGGESPSVQDRRILVDFAKTLVAK